MNSISYRIYSFSLLCFLSMSLAAQSGDPLGPNNYFKNATALSIDSFIQDNMDRTDIDILSITLDQCQGYKFIWGFPDTSSFEFVMNYALYRQDDTLHAIYSGIVNKGNQRSFNLNASGSFYLKLNAAIPDDVGDYGIILMPDTTDRYECNNSAQDARSISVSETASIKLFGYSAYGKPDEDWFSVQVPRCGVLSANALEPADNQRLVLSVYSKDLELVGQSTASIDGEAVSIAVLVESGEYLIRVTEFDTCCGTGNDLVYNLMNHAILLSVSFDSSDVAECNNSFESAYSLPINTPFEARLYGYDLRQEEQPWDLDFFQFKPEKCGVLNLSLNHVPNSQTLVVTVYNSRKEQINFSVAGCEGCDVNLSTQTDGQTVYVKIAEFVACCSGNNAIYNLVNEPFTINSSFDTSDVYECNDIFSDAASISSNDSLYFKIWGKNSSNRLGSADRDIFKLYSENCSEIKLKVDQIPFGFDLRAKVFADTLNLNSPLVDIIAKGPDTLNLTVNIPSGKTYYLVFTEDGENAFSNQLMRASFIWINKGPAAPLISLNGNPEFCLGDSLTLTSSIEFGNRWSNGDTTRSITIKTTGVYRDTISDGGICYAISEPVSAGILENPTALFLFQSDRDGVTFANESIGASAYSWSFGDGETSTEKNPVHAYQDAGSYNVTLLVSNACESDSISQMVNYTVSALSLNEPTFKVYPQPSSGVFKLKGLNGTNQPLSYRVIDASGRILVSGNLTIQSEYQFNLNLSTGFYYLLIGNEQVENKIPLMILHQ